MLLSDTRRPGRGRFIRASATVLAASLTLVACGGGNVVGGLHPPTTSTGGQSAPVISGKPVTTVGERQSYAFRPSAYDADGDRLRFEVSNKPAWASFDATTGRLTGTPPAGAAGRYSGIRIAVTDGTSKTALPPFSITVVTSPAPTTGSAMLTWSKPTLNDDGTPLTDLAGYRIYYGPSPSDMTKKVDIGDPNLTSAEIGQLTSGTWNFSVTAVNASGVESRPTRPVTKTI